MMAHAHVSSSGRRRYTTPELCALLCVIGGNVALGEPLADDYKWLNALPHNDGPRRSIVGSDHACINVAVSIGLAAARRTGR